MQQAFEKFSRLVFEAKLRHLEKSDNQDDRDLVKSYNRSLWKFGAWAVFCSVVFLGGAGACFIKVIVALLANEAIKVILAWMLIGMTIIIGGCGIWIAVNAILLVRHNCIEQQIKDAK